jgi:DNA modification methylase
MNIKKSKRPIGQLQTDPHNPRSLNKEKYKKLKSSIEAFPEMLSVRPLVVADGYVVGGNMRLLALKELGYREVEVIDVSDWTKAQRDEFMIKDNLSFGDWDWDLLANEWNIDDLTEWGMDLWDTEPEEMKGLTDEDDIPEAPEEPTTKLGDVWILGEHRVMCGDSTNAADVALLMAGEKAVLLHADPPYGMGKEKDGVLNDNLYSDKLDKFQMDWWKAFRPHLEDNASAYIWGNAPDLWRLWYRGGLQESERLTMRNEVVWDKKHGEGMNSDKHRMFPTATERCLFFMIGEQGFNNNADNYWKGWDKMMLYLKKEKDKSGLTIKDLKKIAGHSQNSGCHWFDKSQWMMPTKETYKSWQTYCKNEAFAKDYEVLKKEFYSTRAYFNNTHDNMTEVWQFERVKGADRHGHATPKPVDMMERVMKSSAPTEAVTIEPFLGSGSTLIGAEKTGRKCYGMELDPKYCDLVVKRWEDYTGKKANKE